MIYYPFEVLGTNWARQAVLVRGVSRGRSQSHRKTCLLGWLGLEWLGFLGVPLYLCVDLCVLPPHGPSVRQLQGAWASSFFF